MVKIEEDREFLKRRPKKKESERTGQGDNEVAEEDLVHRRSIHVHKC